MLHTLAIANEAEIDYDLRRVNEIAKRVPYLSKIAPSSAYSMHDVHEAGGVSAIIGSFVISRERFILIDRLSQARRYEKMSLKRRSTTKKLFIPKKTRIVLWVVYRSCTVISPQKAVLSRSVGSIQVSAFKGKAICFDSHDEAVAPSTIIPYKKRHVVVIRYEGPKGGPGMPEMLAPTSSIVDVG